MELGFVKEWRTNKMGLLTIKNSIFFMWSDSNQAYDPSVKRINKKQIKEYCEKHPYPENQIYSSSDMFYDITQSGGVLYIPENTPIPTMCWLVDMIEYFMQKEEKW
jgi:hypothetical protein